MSRSRFFPSIIALFLLSLTGAARLWAQGGPPMITDDPGTPGNGHWEINLAWTDQRTPGSTLFALPLLDANYGVGDRIEVTYEAPWAIVRDAAGSRAGEGNSLIGAKWRFADNGDHGWQASVYPQLTFLNPGSDSDRRGLADPDTTLLLPFEVEKDIGSCALNFDFGHVFGPTTESSGWMGGVLWGHNLTKAWEVDAEVHLNVSERLNRAEWVVNAGTRVDLSEHLTVLLAVGRDLSNQIGPRVSLLSYAGLQLRL